VDGFEGSGSNKSTPTSIPSPSSGINLSSHPFFRQEYALPLDESFEALVEPRRIRATASPPSSPATSVVQLKARDRKAKREKKSKASMAGLVGGDSDSSALTQESGDEDLPTPRESAATATDGGTDAENDWAQDSSPG
jgi:MRG-binding protein